MKQDQHPVYNAAAIMCIDGAWIVQSLAAVIENFGDTIDLHTIPGAAKDFNSIFMDNKFASILIENIVNISMGIHGVSDIVVVSHCNCAGYGTFDSSEHQARAHRDDLMRAKSFLIEQIKLRVLEILDDKGIPMSDLAFCQLCQTLSSYEGFVPKISCFSWQLYELNDEYKLVEVFD